MRNPERPQGKGDGAPARSRVSLVRCPNYDPGVLKPAVAAALAGLGGTGLFFRPGVKVLLKPNLMMPKPLGFPANTHPAFLQAVVEIALEAGAAVTVGESSAGSQAGLTFTKRALSESGVEEVCRRTGVPLINFDLDAAVMTPLGNPFVPSVPLAKSVLDADLVVSLPKFKTHTFGNYITGAVKNMYGTIPGQRKADGHRAAPKPADFYTVVRDVYRAVRPGLAIFDGVEAMDGDGPSAGRPFPLGLILAGADGVAADAVAAKLIGVPELKVLTTRLCAEAGLGRGRLADIEIVGEPLDAVRPRDFRLPKIAAFNPSLYRFILKMTETIPVVDRDRCTLCHTCVDSCPMKAISEADKAIVFDRSTCIRCFCCSEVCPQQAIAPKRKNALGDLLAKLMKSRW